MFMFQENKVQKERLEKIFKKVTLIYGSIPPQMELLGNIDADYLEDFLKMVLKIIKHPNIEANFFGFLRLHIAFKENYNYCKAYNSDFLLKKGYEQEKLNKAIKNILDIPFDKRHQALAQHAIQSIYEGNTLKQHNFDTLYKMNWTQKDIFDATEHAGTIFRNGRILTAYSIKD